GPFKHGGGSWDEDWERGGGGSQLPDRAGKPADLAGGDRGLDEHGKVRGDGGAGGGEWTFGHTGFCEGGGAGGGNDQSGGKHGDRGIAGDGGGACQAGVFEFHAFAGVGEAGEGVGEEGGGNDE